MSFKAIPKSVMRDTESVRPDVYVRDDDGTVYDIEMQVASSKELPKRTRYYQGMIDMQLIDKGQSYKRLNPSYIIFICSTDFFGKGRHIYTFENICVEDKEIFLGDDTVKIFLNADSMMDDVSDGLRAFLDYVAGKEPDDSYVKKLDDAVREAKKNREWRHEYMTLLMRDQENIEKGIEQGIEQGIAQGIMGMVEALRDLYISDDVILQKIQEKFLLTEEEALRYL